MSVSVEPNHPLAELLGKMLLGIESVPQKEQTRMVCNAIRAAVNCYKELEKEVNRLKEYEFMYKELCK